MSTSTQMQTFENEVTIVGKIKEITIVKESVFFTVAVKRLSQIIDELLVKTDLKASSMDFVKGDNVFIRGYIYTENQLNIIENQRKVHIYIVPFKILHIEDEDFAYYNEFEATGKICKMGELVTIKDDKILLSCILRTYGGETKKPNFIPLVFWGETAKFIAKYPVHSIIKVEGHFKSRLYYSKKAEKLKTTYEVSVVKVRIIDQEIEKIEDGENNNNE